MQEMLKDNRVIYILGNHEQMLLDYYKDGIEKNLITSKELITYNGCYQTLINFQKLTELEQKKLIEDLYNKTKNYYIYINKEKKNIFLSHAGTNIDKLNDTTITQLMWDRNHIKNEVPYNVKYKYWYIVHGHTPVQIINPNKKIIEIYRYFNNHKIDIDLGTQTSNMIAVLDLDNLQVKYFKGEINNGSTTRDIQ